MQTFSNRLLQESHKNVAQQAIRLAAHKQGPGHKGLSSSALVPPESTPSRGGVGVGGGSYCGAGGEQPGAGGCSCPRRGLTTSEGGLNPRSAFCCVVPGHNKYNKKEDSMQLLSRTAN